MSSIGDRVKQLRAKLRLTQADFGASIGVKGGVVSAWESGKAPVPYGRVLIICDTFGVNATWLTSGKGKTFVAQTVERNARANAQEYVVSLLDRMSSATRNDVLEFCREILKRYDAE